MKKLILIFLLIMSSKIYSQNPPVITFDNLKPRWSYYLYDHNYPAKYNIIGAYEIPIIKDSSICFNGIRFGSWFDGLYVECIDIGSNEGFFKYSSFNQTDQGKETLAGITINKNDITIRSFKENVITNKLPKPFWLYALLKKETYDLDSENILNTITKGSSDTLKLRTFGMPYPAFGFSTNSTLFTKYDDMTDAYYQLYTGNNEIIARRYLLGNNLEIVDEKKSIIKIDFLPMHDYGYRPRIHNNDEIIGTFTAIHWQPDTLNWKLNAVVIDKDLNIKFNTDLSKTIPILESISFTPLEGFGYVLFGLNRAVQAYDKIYLLNDQGLIYRTIPINISQNINTIGTLIVSKLTVNGKDELILTITPKDTPKSPIITFRVNDNNTFTQLGSLKINSTLRAVFADYFLQINDHEVLIQLNEQVTNDPERDHSFISYHLFDLNQLGIISSTSSPTAMAAPLIFPNPAIDHITLSGLSPTSKISIYATDGRQISIPIINKDDQIDISQLTSGLYFLRVSDGARVSNYKFMKQ